MSLFISTHSYPHASLAPCTFQEAIFANSAADGGLFLPDEHPQIPPGAVRAAAEAHDFGGLSAIVAAGYDRQLAYTPEIYRQQIFPFSPRITMLHKRLALLELYHGPTCAFKDFGAAFLSFNMEQRLARTQERIIVLTATSGDTGSAVAHAFYQKNNIDVVVLYPANRVSTLQEAHINGFSKNIHSIRVRGTFDDCQALVKQAFVDREYGDGITFSSANSINIGRLLPQSFYYHYAFHLVRAGDGLIRGARNANIHFCVPSGNLGNLTAGVLAWKAGLPVRSFIVATNSNRAVPRYLKSGVYKPRRTVHTISNAMDVGSPNNFTRLHALYGKSHAQMARHVTGHWVSERETRRTIVRHYREYGRVVDPHTATALAASERALRGMAGGGDDIIICLSTAHAAKFGDTIKKVLRREVELPPQLAEASRLAQATPDRRASRAVPPAPDRTIAPRYSALREYLLGKFAR